MPQPSAQRLGRRRLIPAARARIASTYEELAVYALSRVPVPAGADAVTRAAALRPEPWVSPEVARVFDEDRAALAALAPSGLLAAQHLPRLFASLDEARDLGAGGLAALAARRPSRALAGALAGDARLAELLLCDVLLAARAFEAGDAPRMAARAELARAATTAALGRAWAALAGVDVIFSAALGAAGRAFRGDDGLVVYVGVGGDGAVDAERAGALALHEVAVARGPARYEVAERAAIEAVRALVDGTPLAAGHARLLAGLDLSALPAAADVQEVTRAVAERLRGRG